MRGNTTAILAIGLIFVAALVVGVVGTPTRFADVGRGNAGVVWGGRVPPTDAATPPVCDPTAVETPLTPTVTATRNAPEPEDDASPSPTSSAEDDAIRAACRKANGPSVLFFRGRIVHCQDYDE